MKLIEQALKFEEDHEEQAKLEALHKCRFCFSFPGEYCCLKVTSLRAEDPCTLKDWDKCPFNR